MWSYSRHQRLYSLLDRLRLATAPGSRGPSPPVTSHPLDGDGPLALETVIPDKVSVWPVCACDTQGPGTPCSREPLANPEGAAGRLRQRGVLKRGVAPEGSLPVLLLAGSGRGPITDRMP